MNRKGGSGLSNLREDFPDLSLALGGRVALGQNVQENREERIQARPLITDKPGQH